VNAACDVCIEQPGPYDCDGCLELLGGRDDSDMTDDERLLMDDTTHDVGRHRITFGWRERLERITDGSLFDVAVGFALGVVFTVVCYGAWWALEILSESKY
jgi:hypothetical protein